MTETTKFDPDWVVAPGEILKEWLEEKDLAPSSARFYGLDERTIKRLYSGDQEINETIADRLEKMTAVSANFWLALEQLYRFGLAAGKTSV